MPRRRARSAKLFVRASRSAASVGVLRALRQRPSRPRALPSSARRPRRRRRGRAACLAARRASGPGAAGADCRRIRGADSTAWRRGARHHQPDRRPSGTSPRRHQNPPSRSSGSPEWLDGLSRESRSLISGAGWLNDCSCRGRARSGCASTRKRTKRRCATNAVYGDLVPLPPRNSLAEVCPPIERCSGSQDRPERPKEPVKSSVRVNVKQAAIAVRKDRLLFRLGEPVADDVDRRRVRTCAAVRCRCDACCDSDADWDQITSLAWSFQKRRSLPS